MHKPILTIITFLLSSLSTLSQPAVGEVTAHFGKEILPLWDLTGTYHTVEGGIISQFTLSHSANGRLSLAGSSNYDDDASNTHLTGTSSGSGRVTGTVAKGTKGFAQAVGYVSGLVNGSYRTATGRGRENFTV